MLSQHQVHAMIDCETWGKRPGCAIRSVAAVMFEPWSSWVGLGSQAFYANVLDYTNHELNLGRDPDTIKWWYEQSEEAQAVFESNPVRLDTALGTLKAWFAVNHVEIVWAQGAAFDPPILEEIYRRLNVPWPWKFYNLRDTRTAYDLGGILDKTVPWQEGYRIPHHALHDAIHQAHSVQANYRNLKRVPLHPTQAQDYDRQIDPDAP